MNKSNYKKIKIFVIILLVASFVTSSIYVISNLMQEKKQDNDFEKLENLITVTNENEINNTIEEQTDNVVQDNAKPYSSSIDLSNLYEINNDLIGWIEIDGTNINYPIMQNDNYYLKRNIYKEYSNYGTPFLASYCNINASNNLIIYGHHIKSGKMFADLVKYSNYNYYKSHKFIKLYTLQENITIEHIYEVFSCFKTTADDNGFKYYDFYNTYSEDEYNEYVENCKNLSIFDTGVDSSYGDRLITLSTCEYSQTNGRMVVVAKQIE